MKNLTTDYWSNPISRLLRPYNNQEYFEPLYKCPQSVLYYHNFGTIYKRNTVKEFYASN